MNLKKLRPIEIQTIIKTWKDLHSLIQNGGFITPTARLLDKNDNLQISVVHTDSVQSLFNDVVSRDFEFAVLNHYGFLIEGKKRRKCIISTLMRREIQSDVFLLFEETAYQWQNLDFDKIYKLDSKKSKSKLGYVFNSILNGSIKTILPSVEEFSEICKIIDKAKATNDWTQFKHKLENFDVNIRSNSGESILHELVDKTPIEITEMVLEKGCDPNHKNLKYGRTAAFYCYNFETHQLLIDFGLDINYLDTSGWTAAFYNIYREKILETHIKNGLNLNLKDLSGSTILFEAVNLNEPQYIKMILAGNADIDIQDNFGMTALFRAVESNQHKSIKLLLEFGASKDIKTIKDYFIDLENTIILPSGSTVFNFIEVLQNWRNTSLDEKLQESFCHTHNHFHKTIELVYPKFLKHVPLYYSNPIQKKVTKNWLQKLFGK